MSDTPQVTSNTIIDILDDNETTKLLELLYELRDKKSPLQYIVVSPALHTNINSKLFSDNKWKVRIEELSWFRYSVSHLWNDPDVPQYALSPLDIGKIVAVYTDYEGNQITINDLFNNIHKEWQKQVNENQKS